MTSSLNGNAPAAAQVRRGLLLLNVGTPDAPTESAVREYLREFLMDPLVIDIPYLFRWMLVHGAILPKRPAVSAAAYRKIWSERGSPLLEHLDGLVSQVRDLLPSGEWVVAGAMRYGKPSIASVVADLRRAQVSEIVVLPMYPQYSLAATESGIREVARVLRDIERSGGGGSPLRVIPAFYSHPSFIRSFAHRARASLQGYPYDHLLFSFHGLPERQVRKTDRSTGGAHCLASADCCDRITDVNRDCYRAQCYATAHLIARELGLARDRYTVCFQSRLGRTPWIKPYTDHLYPELAQKGVKRLAVMCPAFVADCLETLEEVQIRGLEQFRSCGGEDLKLVPSLNSAPDWAQAVAELAQQPGPGGVS